MKEKETISAKQKAEKIAIILLYPFLMLFNYLGKSIKLFNTKNKQIVASALSLALILGMVPLASITAFAASDPSLVDGYYQLGSAYDLAWFATKVNSGQTTINAKLTANIDFGAGNTTNWTPIGTDDTKAYNGKFDGNGKTISNLYLNNNAIKYMGLFGYTGQNSEIKNLGIANFNITSSKGAAFIGGVCSYNSGKITNCYNTGVTTCKDIIGGNNKIGSVCGYNGGTIANCYNTATINASTTFFTNLGGVCGENEGKMTNCYNTGALNPTNVSSARSNSYTGGVCAINSDTTSNGTMTNCYNTGAIKDISNAMAPYTGGICGQSKDGAIKNCYSTGEVTTTTTGVKTYVRAFCGKNVKRDLTTNCYYQEQTGLAKSPEATSKTEEQFKSGEVCYLLNGSTSEGDTLAFYQTLGTDNTPVLDNTHKTVYQDGDSYKNPSSEPEQDPDGNYLIKTVEDLTWFANEVNGGNNAINGKLANDIDFGSDNTTNWTPIGNLNQNYNGKFDGNGKTISHLYLNDNISCMGLFGYAGRNSEIKNLGIADFNITFSQTNSYVGGVCGYNLGKITNCYNTNAITFTATSNSNSIGSVCGRNGRNGSTITNCYNTGDVNLSVTKDRNIFGGVCGYNDGGIITNCYNTGNVKETNTYSSSSSNSYTGGVCADNEGTMTNCYNTGDVSDISNTIPNIGGLCAYNGKSIKNCYSTGAVTTTSNIKTKIGAFCGVNNQALLTQNCYYQEQTELTDKNVTSKTEAEFKSGAVAYLLNDSKSEGDTIAFYQNLDNGQTVDNTPVLDSTHGTVYQDEEKFSNTKPLTPPSKDSDDNYLITTVDELRWFANAVNGGKTDINAKLMNDIDFNGSETNQWTPIGNDSTTSKKYTGKFDGQNHVVKNLYYNGSISYVGFFGCVGDGGEIQNVGIVDCNFTGSIGYIGGVCAYTGKSIITNCYNTGKITSTKSSASVGGICGSNGATITNCYNTCDIVSTGKTSKVGGVCGSNNGTTKNCYNNGTVTVSDTGTSTYVGGMCGYNYRNGTIINCYNTGTVDYTVTETGNTNARIGGVCGPNEGKMTNCYNIGAVNDTGIKTMVGGVCAYKISSATITNCYYQEQTELTDSNATSKTAQQFKSGEVCYLLNGDQTEINFYQTLGTDNYPILDSTHDVVCKSGDDYSNKLSLTKDNFNYTAPSKLVYNGGVKQANVTAKDGVNCGAITVKYYKGDTLLTALPSETGTYTVKIDVAENDNYTSATDLTDASWKFTITPVTTAEISIGTNSFKSFLNTITFGLFFKNTQTVTVKVNDLGSGAKNIRYFVASEETDVKSADFTGWKNYTSSFSINPNNKYVIYAVVTDNEDNLTYVSSNGVVLDDTVPVISGVENNGTYYTTQKATVSDANLESIVLNGNKVTGNEIVLDGNKTATYQIIVTDKAKNVTSYSIYMMPIGTLAQDVISITKDNVKAEDKTALNNAKSKLEGLDTTNATTSEKNDIAKRIAKIDESLKAIENAEKSAEEISKLPTKDSVKLSDKDAVTTAKNNYYKLTNNEKTMVGLDNRTKLDSLVDAINNAENVIDEISKLPTKDNTKLSDKEALEKAKNDYNNLTENEKSMVGEDKLNKVNDSLKAIENAQKIIDEISKLPSKDNTKLTDKKALETAKDNYEKLTDNEKSMVGSDNLNKVTDALKAIENAQKVIDKISKLPTKDKVTLKDKDSVKTAKDNYEKLSDNEKLMVGSDNSGKLADTVKAIENAEKVIDDISKLPTKDDTKLTDKDALKTAKDNYEKLSDNEKSMVGSDSFNKVNDALKAIENAEKVIDEISKIPSKDDTKLADKDSVKTANDNYEKLSDNEKSMVGEDNSGKLADTVKAIENAEKVIDEISKLPTKDDTKLADKDSVNTANDNYEKLTENEKLMVGEENSNKLADTVKAIENAQKVIDEISKLPTKDDTKLADKDALKTAKDNYEKLSDNEKSMVGSDSFNKVNDALKAIENAEKVLDTIKNLPSGKDVKLSDKATIDALKEAYDKLTDSEKAMIGADYQKQLDDAMNSIKTLEKQAEDVSKKSPTTGDATNAIPALAVLVISGGLFTTLFAFKKRKKED